MAMQRSKARKAEARDATHTTVMNSARWQKLRRLKRANDPLCQPCKAEGLTVPAQQVHHIVAVKVDASLAYTLANLLSVCTSCHARLEAQA